MDEHTKCRLLSSVFQPFVSIGPGLLVEVENFLIQAKSVHRGHCVDDLRLLVQAVDLLAHLTNDVKAVLGTESVGAGWPLCTDRFIACHLGDPLAGPSNHSILDHLKTGDFYYCIIPVKASEEIGFRFAVFALDSGRGDFVEISLEWDNFLTLLRNCHPSATVNDRLVESIRHRSSIGDEGKKRAFRRCLVRNGKNSSLELVTWKQLCRNWPDRLCHGDSSFTFTFCAHTTPLLDFIDDSPPRACPPIMSTHGDGLTHATRQTEESGEKSNECDGSVKAALSLALSTASSTVAHTNRIPKRIVDICRQLFSDGCISFTGSRYRGDDRCALIEIRLSNGSGDGTRVQSLVEQTIPEFANALLYLYSIHRRCVTTSKVSEDTAGTRKDRRLVLVVRNGSIGQEEEEDSEALTAALRYFKEVIHLYLQRVPSGLERTYFVDICPDEITNIFSDMDESLEQKEETSKISVVNSAELNERVGGQSEFTDAFGGTVTYDRRRWVAYRQDLERFMDVCRTVAKNCVANIQTLKDAYSDSNMAAFWSLSSQELEKELYQLKEHETKFEKDPSSVQLEQTGEEDLRAIQEGYEDLKHLRSYREATEKVSALYAEVCKVVVKVRNGVSRRLTTLETYMSSKKFLEIHEKLMETSQNIIVALKAYSGTPDNGRTARTTLQQLEIYYNDTIRSTLTEANELLGQISDFGHDCLSLEQKEVVLSAADQLQSISKAASDASDSTRGRLRNIVSCHDFLDQAYDWALDGREMLNRLAYSTASTSRRPSDELQTLAVHLANHPPISPTYFASKLRVASEAGDEKLVIQFKAVQERCLNTERALLNWVKLLETAVDGEEEQQVNAAASTASSETGRSLENRCVDQTGTDCASVEDRPVQRCRPCSVMSSSTSVLSAPPGLEVIKLETANVESSTAGDKADFTGIITDDLTETVVSEISENTLRKKRVERMAAQNASNGGISGRKGSLPAPPPPSAELLKVSDKSKTRRPFRKLMKRSNTSDDIVVSSKPTRHQSLESLPSISEESSDGVALTSKSVPLGDRNICDDIAQEEAEGDSATDTAPPFLAPVPPSSLAAMAYGRPIPSPLPNCSPNVRMQHMVANELLLTEEAYVASLQYVIEHYLSEMHRTDLPQQLLGQRLTIFGNIEKIFEFHIGQFLPELKRNCSEANDALGAQVAKCFLKYRSKFHLYALYNKNKPKSDALMTECAAVFFRTKQLLLRDKLDLSSYLLKPVQRMGKYALMLQQLIKACPPYDQEQLETLKAAEELVTFQLRHGNDLLAMDSIQRCDMNLKEQGQLLRQDEFVVFEGRTNHKCVRRVFLFEHLVLFAKPRRIRGACGVEREVYETKRCIKMSDVGLTEQVGDSDIKFELWFLRHTSGQRFVLQASSPSVRTAWVCCIRRILWNQALSNRELRKAEMSSMGSNVCVDLKPSKDRIEDRALNASLLMKVAHPRITVTRIGHSATCSDIINSQSKRPHSLISVGSSTSSSNMSSTTDSSGYHLRAVSVMETRHIRMSSESGICSDFNRSDARSSLAGEDDQTDENRALSNPKTEDGMKAGIRDEIVESVDGAMVLT